MDTTEAEGFAVDQLQEQGLKDVPKFFAGSVSRDDYLVPFSSAGRHV